MLNIEKPYPHKYAFLQLGFRPFFLASLIFGALSMVLWMGIYTFDLNIQPAYPATLWHGHEMIFGYALAAVAGFLLTAVKNWTGVQTAQGTPLLFLLLAWLFARLFSLDALLITPYFLVVSDLLFNAVLCYMIVHPVIKSKQWQHLIIASKVGLLLIANIIFYLGYLNIWPMGLNYGLYAGLYLILSLIFMMARRVIPFFIEKGVNENFTPTNKHWLDISSLFLFLAYALLKVIHLYPALAAILATTLFTLHAYRLYGWYTHGIWKKPLVWSLYVGYIWLVVGFLMDALNFFFSFSPYLSLHAFTFGGVGMITVGMMARVALGHTGRNVAQPPEVLNWVFLILWLGVFIRVILPIYYTQSYAVLVGTAQVMWIIAFVLMAVTYLPILIKARIDGRHG